jgi:hypothetical protein
MMETNNDRRCHASSEEIDLISLNELEEEVKA